MRIPFARWAFATTAATYVLIGIGALVRAADAGLGCPDWPRCFGRWIPPVSADELPPGFDRAAFNPAHTWLEYGNRLMGVLIGLLILGAVISAWREHRRRREILYPTLAAFVLVLVQGWLGGMVVQSRLSPHVLTAHMVLALVIVGLLLYATLVARLLADGNLQPAEPSRATWAALAVGLLLLMQIGVGTKVRGALQALEKTQPDLARSEWLPLGFWPDLLHRQLGVVLVIAALVLAWRLRNRWSRVFAATAVAQMLAGLGLAYLAVPPVLQVIHVVLAALSVGALTVVVFLSARSAALASEQ